MSLNYIGNLIDKAKRYISGYPNSTITVTIFLHDDISHNEWNRFIKEFNPEVHKLYDHDGSLLLSETFCYVADLVEHDGTKIQAFSSSYLNPDYIEEKSNKLYEKRQHCREVYQQFLKEKRELGCIGD